MKIQAAFIFLIDDADETTRGLIETSNIALHVIGRKNYEEAIIIAKDCAAKDITAIELCAGFGNEGIARIQQAVGLDVAVGAVKFDYHPSLGYKSGDRFFQ